MSGFTPVTVTGTYLDPSTGAPRTGTVTFTLPGALHNGDQTSATSWTAGLDSGGRFTIALPATDDLGTTPQGSVYRVVEALNGSTAGSTYALPVVRSNAAAGIRLAAVPAVGEPAARVSVTGSQSGNAALASLLAALVTQGLITDNTTA